MQQMTRLLRDMKARTSPIPEALSSNATQPSVQTSIWQALCTAVIVHATLSPFRL